MTPRAPANRPSPPVTVQMTAPRWQPATGLGATVPRPTVSNAIAPALPYAIVPASTKVPSPRRSTSDSRTACSPATGSIRAATPSGPSTLESAWLGAVVFARRFVVDPGRAQAAPLNSSANTSSRTPAPTGSATVPDPGIEEPVHDVDRQVDGHEHDRDEENGGLRQRVVALVDRPEDQPPHAREREDLLDDDRPAEQDAHLKSGDGHDGDERVLQRMLEHHRASRQPLRRRRPDVLGAQHVEHARARGARDVGGARGPETKRGKEHDREVSTRVGEEIDPHDGRHPAQVDGEEEDQQRPLPEHGYGQAEERADPHGVVHGAVAADRRHDARGDAE